MERQERADAGTEARRLLAQTTQVQHEGGFETRSIHAGYHPDSHTGAINVPIYASTTFAQDDVAQLRGGYEYGRVGNPTVVALENVVAALENAQYGRAFASGMAATDTILRVLLKPGDHLILGNDAYGGTFRLIDTTLKDWGVNHSVVDMSNVEEIRAALRPETKVVWAETPTNPMLGICDIRAISELLQDHPARLVVDNTFATPYLQRPLDLGADVVVHSTTKYLGGHSDVLGGLVITNDLSIDEEVLFIQGGVGAVMSPFDAFLTIRGVKTLAVRMDRHCSNAATIAEFLDTRPEIAQVSYPGLSSHPGHDQARKQMKNYGGMISIRFRDGEQAAVKFCRATKIITLAESLGGVESLLEHPARMTHQSAEGSQLEVPADFVRISVGIENCEDLIADLTQALDSLAQ